jgi:hypothetical protein
MIDEIDAVLTRCTRNHVRHVFVGGRQIVKDGCAVGVDLEAIENELLAQARAAGASMRALRPVMERSQATLRAFYSSGGHLTGR